MGKDRLPYVPKLCRRKDGRLYATDPHLKKQIYFRTHDEYEEWRAVFLERVRRIQSQGQSPPVLPGQRVTVARLCEAYLDHAREWYRKDGQPTSEVGVISSMIKRLVAVAGGKQADRLRVADVDAMLAKMIEDGLSRRTINALLRKLKTMVRWAVRQEVLSGETLGRISSVGALPKGRTGAKEKPKVRPVEQERLDATLPHLAEVYRAMALVQLYSGMRPGEVARLRAGEIDRGAEPWEYLPAKFKTQHRHEDEDEGKRRIFFGPQAREVLTPLLNACKNPNSPLFRRRGDRPVTVVSYDHAVEKACAAAGVQHWSPNQLRHLAATKIRKRHGIEAAQTVLGHAQADVTLVYAERDANLAKKIVEEMG